MVTLQSLRPISWRAPSLFDYEQPPDAWARRNAEGRVLVHCKDPFQGCYVRPPIARGWERSRAVAEAWPF
jgi:hypothetical protein